MNAICRVTSAVCSHPALTTCCRDLTLRQSILDSYRVREASTRSCSEADRDETLKTPLACVFMCFAFKSITWVGCVWMDLCSLFPPAASMVEPLTSWGEPCSLSPLSEAAREQRGHTRTFVGCEALHFEWGTMCEKTRGAAKAKGQPGFSAAQIQVGQTRLRLFTITACSWAWR